MTNKRKRVRCAGCNRRMYQSAKHNRDMSGRSWHYDCLVTSINHAYALKVFHCAAMLDVHGLNRRDN